MSDKASENRICKAGRLAVIVMLLLMLLPQAVYAGPVVVTDNGESSERTSEEGSQSSSENTSEESFEENSLAQRLYDVQKEIERKQVGRYGMVPVYARDLEDGVYPIEVETTSPYFRIPEAELTVDGDDMTARITIRSMSYSYVYPGTAEEAMGAEEADWIGFEEVDGCTVFTIPVEALDAPVPCASYSKKKRLWYDRLLVFNAASLPEGVVKIDLPDYELIEEALKDWDADGEIMAAEDEELLDGLEEPILQGMEISKSDGEYSIEVNMTGGSGRASISSPTLLIVRNGRAYARLIWSSSYYDYMIVENRVYHNLATDGGNSVFEIPILAMDTAMPVVADTTAMGEPVEINYTLAFYSESVGDRGKIPQEAAKKVLLIALVILVGGGILNHFLKRGKS